MDGAEVLRAVRRRTGLSQRELAGRTGVALSTISAVEAGRRPPSLSVLMAVLAAAGLELSVDLIAPQVGDADVRHLQLSLEQRLHLAVGGDGRPGPGRRPPLWEELLRLAGHFHVHLHGRTALAMWLSDRAPGPVQACVRARTGRSGAPPAGSSIELVPPCDVQLRTPVTVRIGYHQVTVDPPADLALDPEHAVHRGALRAVARVLHQQSARDEAGRRTRAHRDPDHADERRAVFHTKRFHHLEMPPFSDARSWRLDDDASLVAWLRRYDHPV